MLKNYFKNFYNTEEEIIKAIQNIGTFQEKNEIPRYNCYERKEEILVTFDFTYENTTYRVVYETTKDKNKYEKVFNPFQNKTEQQEINERLDKWHVHPIWY